MTSFGTKAEDDVHSSSKPEKILLIGALPSEEHCNLPSTYAYDRVGDIETALSRLYDQTYDLVVLCDAVFVDQMYLVIVEIKRRKPETPLVVVTGNTSGAYHANLMDAGTDDVVGSHISPSDFRDRLNINIRRGQRLQRDYGREVALYQIMHLTQQLNTLTEPNGFIEKTVSLICTTFNLYGCAVIIPDNELMQVYVSNYSGKSKPRFMREMREQTVTDPFTRPIFNGVIEAFQDISTDRYYRPLPLLPDARSVLVIPLRQHTDLIGALVLFGNAGQQFELEDISVFETLASQLVGSLQNAFFQEAQNFQVQLNKTLLNAWQTLFHASTGSEIASTLGRLIEEIPNVDHALVWLTGETHDEMVVFSSPELSAARDTLSNLLKQTSIDDLIDTAQFEGGIIQQTQLSPTNPLRPLFRALGSRRLIFFPLENSASLIGGMVISIAAAKQFGINDVSLVRNLALAAGQALERITLIDAMAEKSARLEVILRSISEGIFFVDDLNRVAFFNPQAMELLDVKPSEILDKQSFVLLDRLSSRAANPEQARRSLFAAVDSINSSSRQPKDNYPIVEFDRPSGTNQTVRVEFIAIDAYPKWYRSWIGFIQTTDAVEKDVIPTDTVSFLVNTLMETGAGLANNIDLLINSGSQDQNTQRLSRLTDVRHGVMAMRQLVQNVAQYSAISPTYEDYLYEQVDLDQVISEVIQDEFADRSPALRFTRKPGQYEIELDPQIVRRALIRLFDDAIARCPAGGSIAVSLEDTGEALQIAIEQPLTIGRHLGDLSPFDLIAHDVHFDLSNDVHPFYLLVQLFQCRIRNVSVAGKTQRLIIAFPLPSEEESGFPDSVSADVVMEVDRSAGAPVRAPDTVMMIKGKSVITENLARLLEHEGFEVIVPTSPLDAVDELRLVHLDLIVIDGALTEIDALELTQRMRRAAETPIVVIADKATDNQRVEVLNAGAEDYVVAPISDAELFARIRMLFRRQHLADRTEAPLDFGDLRIDFARRQVYVNRKPIVLTRIEYDLLNVLVKNKGQVVVHQTLLERVWGPEYLTETQYLWVHISRLRKKLEPTAYIQNQARIGYVFQHE